jgi:phosphoribosylaminoimidazole (AIR) synthetase
MVAIVPAAHAVAAAELLTAHGESAHIVGEVRSGDRGVVIRE